MPPDAPPTYQLLVFSGEEIRTFDLPSAGDVAIGRAEGSVVRIDDASVSRCHAVLRVGDTKRLARWCLGLPALLLVLTPSCSAGPPSKTSLFSVPGGPTPPTEFYELPFPNDIRRRADGRPDMGDYPRLGSVVDRYIDAIDTDLDGFGLNAALFVRFGGPIDQASLPATPEASVADGASVYLVNVDARSPDHGRKVPLLFRFEPSSGSTIGPNRLAALPYPGFPLDEGTTYALVVTRRLLVPGACGEVEASDDFVAISSPVEPADAALAAAQRTYAPLWAYLDEPAGDERASVVNAAVFTTQHATDFMARVRETVWMLPAPTAVGITRVATRSTHIIYDGTFASPNFQAGEPPYAQEGGGIQLGADGLPILQRMESLRFSFSIPARLTMPANGWPVVIFAAGTGGTHHAYDDVNVSLNLALNGMAAISIDQVLAGPRNPLGNPDIDFYNFLNPQAARSNVAQGAADNFSLLRLVQGLSHTEAPIGANPARTIRFDATKIYFFGHSQGGVTGPPFVAFEPEVKAAVLSGTSALLYKALLEKKMPFDIAALVKTYIPDDPLDEFNPVLALVQTWAERAEAANYGPLLARRTVLGADNLPLPPKDVFQSEGFVDPWSPNPNIEAFATSVGGNQVFGVDGRVTKTIDGLALRGREVVTVPVSGNLAGKTVVLIQYDQLTWADGHFVALYVPAAVRQWSGFLASHAATGIAVVP